MSKQKLSKEQKVCKARIAKLMTYGKTSEHGLTVEELKLYFADRVMAIFDNWIDGQTCALTPDGRAVVYPEDIDRFLGALFYKQPTYWD